jgi:hemolysin activation/secretion protein
LTDTAMASARRSGGRRAKFDTMRGRWLALACALLLAAPGQHAAAAQPDPLGAAPTIDRDRVDRQEPLLPRAPDQAPAPPASPPAVAGPAATPAAPLARVRFDGSTLSPARLEAVVAPFIGRQLTRDTLQAIANAISAAYATSDVAFHSVAIPRQLVQDGELLVQVREGRIASYALRKETPTTPKSLIAAQMDRLMRDRPTHRSRLERTLSLMRDVPGQTVEAQLRTTAQPDELLLDLDVKRKQVDVTLNVNNNGVVNVVSGIQAQLSVGVHGLLREGDSTSVSANLPFQPGRYQFYSLSHTTPIGANGTTLGVSSAHVRTRTRDMAIPDTEPRDTGIRGEATQAGISVSHALIRSYKRNLSLGLSLDGIDSENYFLDTSFGGFRTRVLRLSATWSSVGDKSGYALAGSVSQGLDFLGARAFEGYSETGFAKANLQATAVTELGKTISLKLTARGQHTRDRLPATERLALGGEGAGMAMRVGELIADRALAGSAEVSWKLPGKSQGAGMSQGAGKGLTIFAYVDGALTKDIARPDFNLPAQDYSLASAGGGLRIGVSGWSASAQIAIPVKRPNGNFGRKARFVFGITRAL